MYLLIYGAMNLGAFAVVIAVARRTRSAEISSYSGLGQYAPALANLMSIFLFSLAGVPPLAGWFAKFVMFRAVLDAGTPGATVLGVIAAVNSVIAFFYYSAVVRQMWFQEPGPRGRADARSRSHSGSPSHHRGDVIVIGIYPQLFAHIGELAAPRLRRHGPRARAERIHREGPIPFGPFVGAALYDPSGFFARGPARGGRAPTSSPAPRSGAVRRTGGRARSTGGGRARCARSVRGRRGRRGCGRLGADVLRAGRRAPRPCAT